MQADALGPWALAPLIIVFCTVSILTLTCATSSKSKSNSERKVDSKILTAIPKTIVLNRQKQSRDSTETNDQKRKENSMQLTTESSYAGPNDADVPPVPRVQFVTKLAEEPMTAMPVAKLQRDLEAPLSAGVDSKQATPSDDVQTAAGIKPVSAPCETKDLITAMDNTNVKSKPLSAMNPASSNQTNEEGQNMNTVAKGLETVQKPASTANNTKIPTLNNGTCLNDPTASVDPEEQFKIKPRKNPVGELKPRKFRKQAKSLKIEAGLCKASKEYPTMDDVMSDWESEKAVTAPESAK